MILMERNWMVNGAKTVECLIVASIHRTHVVLIEVTLTHCVFIRVGCLKPFPPVRKSAGANFKVLFDAVYCA